MRQATGTLYIGLDDSATIFVDSATIFLFIYPGRIRQEEVDMHTIAQSHRKTRHFG
jgi:hypothetical protein